MNPYRPRLPSGYERRAQATDRARGVETAAVFALRLALAAALGGGCAFTLAHLFADAMHTLAPALTLR